MNETSSCCDYCRNFIDDGISFRGHFLAEGGYAHCFIALDDDEYFIKLVSEDIARGINVNYCPVCGRRLIFKGE